MILKQGNLLISSFIVCLGIKMIEAGGGGGGGGGGGRRRWYRVAMGYSDIKKG